MALARFQRTIVDGAGNIIPSPFIEVRREVAGAPLASLYSDREGTNALGNPFQAGADGFAAFHVTGGAYKIRAYSGATEIIWRYVAIGTNAESDFATAFTPRGAWSAVTTYALGDMVSRTNGGDPYAFASNHAANLNNAPPFTGAIGTSDTHWTVVGLIEAPGSPGEPGSSDVVGASGTSTVIGLGAKAFTIVETDRGWGVGARLRASSFANSANFMEGLVASYAGTALTITVDLVGGAGTFADWIINLTGQPGEDGDPGADGTDPGILLNFDTATADADPGAGDLRANNVSLAAATTLFISKTSRGGSDIAAFLLALAASTTATKGTITLTDPVAEAQATFNVTGVTDAVGYVKVAVIAHSGVTTFANALPISFQFARSGDKGADGVGAGDVVGPAGAVDSEIVLFDTATGKLIKSAGQTLLSWLFSLTAKTTLVDADTVAITDSAAANVAKKITWLNFKAALNLLYQPLATILTAIAALGTAGLIARTGAGTVAARSIAVTASTGLSVTNGNGVAGDPTLAGIDATTTVKGVSEFATAAEYRTATDAARSLVVSEVWASALNAVLTDAATIAVDFAAGYNFGGSTTANLNLGGNRTLGAPSNVRGGMAGVLWFGAVTSTRTLTLDAAWVLMDGVAVGPYSITTAQTLGVAYVTRGTTVYVTAILRDG